MKKSTIALSIAILFCAASQFEASAYPNDNLPSASVTKVRANELSFEQLFRAKSYMGKAARQLKFSQDGRYLAYLWNPFNEEGSDLYIYDNQTGQTKRITSPSIMKNYDAPEDWDRFEKKLEQKEKELAERQAKAEAQAAYLRGEKVNLNQWEEAAIEALKKELAEKKAKDAAAKAEKDAEL
ncbi:MAG: hypothetical protein E6Q34_07185, partial [Burkholderiaceae bacterium]